MARTRLYSLVGLACIAGYGWLAYLHTAVTSHPAPSMCFIKAVTHIPCPSCGSSRAVMAILDGHYWSAMMINPMGYGIALIMLVSPAWIAGDVLLKKNSFLHFYRTIESVIRNRWIAIVMIGLVAANWIWNINKGL